MLLAAAVLISVVALIAGNNNRLLNQASDRNALQQVDQVAALLNFSLAPYTTGGDMTEIADFLRELVSVRSQGLMFVGLFDAAGRPIMAVGTPPPGWQPQRQVQENISRLDDSIMVSRPMLLDRNRVGNLTFRLSTRLLDDTRETLLRQTFWISGVALLLALLLLGALGYWLSRRLDPLAAASRAIIAREPMPPLPVAGRDEIALMARALNAMDQAIRRRINDLEEATHEYRGLFDHAAIGIARIELDGRIGVCNNKWNVTLAGSEHGDEVFIQQRYPWLMPAFHELREGVPGDEIILTLNTESGTGVRRYFRLAASVYRSRDGLPRYYIFMLRDVTVETAAAVAQQASSALYRAIAETAQEGMCLIDTDGIIRYANRRMAQIFGDGQTEPLLGQSLPQLLDQQGATAETISALDGRDLLTQDKNGQPVWLMCAFNRLPPDATRGYDGQLCMMIDITSRKQAELKLANYNEQLESEVASRTARLQELNKELEFMSYSISHDLRAPLRAIAGFSGILNENEQAQLSDDGRLLLQRIIAAAKRMNDQLDGMLQFSKLTRSEIHTQNVDLSAMAGTLAEELLVTLNARATVRIGKNLTARADPLLMHVALENLLSNALKYSSKTAEPLIEFDAEQRDGRRVFYVRDNGAGFDPAHAGKLFGLFQRLHANTEFDGTGVGLASVKRIIMRLGGEIWAESSPGAGATFYFHLPQ